MTRERARELMTARGGFAAQSADLMLGFVGGDAPDTGSGYASAATDLDHASDGGCPGSAVG